MNYGPIAPKITTMLHGGDYNPEQWINYEGIWDEDFRLMHACHINSASVGIFSWSVLEPQEGHYNFAWLDEIMNRMAENNMHGILATPSGARPVWLAQKYPEVLRVQANRTKNLYGGRHNHCFSSPIYRQKTKAINEALALRYKDHPALRVWHISNELSGECHCDLCQEAFRNWLKEKYNHDLDQLNHSWWTTFWSHVYTDWSQIESPAPNGESILHGLNLDWKRFVTHQTIDFLKNEIEPLRRITPNIPITTNLMWLFEALDYSKIAKEIDIVSWDSYPQWHNQSSLIEMAVQTAFNHDYFRSLKGGKPFMLMESTPSSTNWQRVSKLKRPQVHLLASMQAVAHGSDSVQYFQWRKSRGSSEKFHGAVVDHCGHENTRVFRDVTDVGNALSKLDDVVGTSVPAQVGIIFDTENRWAIQDYQGFNNSQKNYVNTVIEHYKPFWKAGVPVDVISMDQDFSSYKLLITPMLYMIKPGVAERLDAFVKQGGTLVTTYGSGIVNETDLCFLGGFPGPLKEILGIWVEETDSLYPEDVNYVQFVEGAPFSLNDGRCKSTYKVQEQCDLIHLESASCLATFTDDFYAGRPALTVNRYGEGSAYYIAFRNTTNFQDDFYSSLIHTLNLNPLENTLFEETLPEGVSAQIRKDALNTFIFFMNFSESDCKITLKNSSLYFDLHAQTTCTSTLELKKHQVLILQMRNESNHPDNA